MNLQYQYEDLDVLNVAVSGAKIRNLLSEIANLRYQLQELNDVCTNSHPHTQHSRPNHQWRTMSFGLYASTVLILIAWQYAFSFEVCNC